MVRECGQLVSVIITENFTLYEQTCSICVDDLYHTAYIALVDEDAAEKLVTEICVAGVHKYDQLEDMAEIRFCLTSDLYRKIKQRLRFFTPNTDALPEVLQSLTKQDRLIAAMHYSSGLSETESARILGMKADLYRKKISEIVRKIPLFV